MIHQDAINESPCEQECPRWDECAKGLACQAFVQYVENNRWARNASFIPDRLTYVEVMGDYKAERWTQHDKDLVVELMLDHWAQVAVVEQMKEDVKQLSGMAKKEFNYEITIAKIKANEISKSAIARKFGIETKKINDELKSRGLL